MRNTKLSAKAIESGNELLKQQPDIEVIDFLSSLNEDELCKHLEGGDVSLKFKRGELLITDKRPEGMLIDDILILDGKRYLVSGDEICDEDGKHITGATREGEPSPSNEYEGRLRRTRSIIRRLIRKSIATSL